MNPWNSYIDVLESGREPDPETAPPDLLDAFHPVHETSSAGQHPGLDALRKMAHRQTTRGDSFELPAHLATCPECLDVFLALLDSPIPLTAMQTARFQSVWFPPRQATGRISFLPFIQWAAAAAILTIIAWFGWINSSLHPIAIEIESGSLAANIATPAGITAPAANPTRPPLSGTVQVKPKQSFTVTTPSRIALPDGVQVQAEPETSLAFKRTMRTTTVELNQGRITLDVAPQPAGHTVQVRTPLGTIRVIGTRFEVISASETAVEYRDDGSGAVQSRPLDIASITVRVREGTVAIRTPADEARIHAGQQAVLRVGQPRIDVSDLQP